MFIKSLCALAIFLQVSHSENFTVAEYEAQAGQILTESDLRYNTLLKQVQELSWKADNSGHKRPTKVNNNSSNPLERLRNCTIETCEKMKVIPYDKFENKDLARQVKLLSDLQINGLNEEDFNRAKEILKIIGQFATTTRVCSYRDQNNCTFVYLPNINDGIIRTRTPNEMEYYWIEWRYGIKEQAKALFQEYVELYRKAAALNGHITPSRTWYLHFEDENLLNELSSVMEELRPLYAEFHAYVRYQLRRKYGQDTLASDGPIPEHLMEQVQVHAWRQHSILDTPHPEKHLPNVKDSMIRLKYNPRKIVQISEGFYQSLGFAELASEFWSDYTQMIPEDVAGPDCKSRVYDLHPDVALRYCPKSDFRTLVQMHGTMATVYYNLLKNPRPLGLNREAFPGFGSVIGEAVILSASSPRHLENIGLIENYSVDSELTLNRLFRLGVHTMFSIPMYFVNEKFWVDALDHRIKAEDYNCGYWNIKEEFAGIEPPEYRTEQTLDPGYRFYSGLDDTKSSTIKLLSELMGYQIYRGICLKTGRYVPGNASLPLHNCDFYQNKEAGDLLKELMSFGSTKSWRDLLEIATGERKLSAKPIFEFYGPLYDWMKEFNKINDNSVGWDVTEKCQKE